MVQKSRRYLKVKTDGLPIPTGRQVKGPYKLICVGTVPSIFFDYCNQLRDR